MNHDDSCWVYGKASGEEARLDNVNLGRRNLLSERLYFQRLCQLHHFWKHDRDWLFDSPDVIEQVEREQSIDLTGTTMFYDEVHEEEFDEGIEKWRPYEREEAFTTNIRLPDPKILSGFDIVSSTSRNSPECSPTFMQLAR